MIQPVPNGIPKELQEVPHWIVWLSTPAEPKPRKMPINAKDGQTASVTDPHTWSEFRTVVKMCNRYDYAGIGFVLDTNSPYCVVDIDNAFGPDGFTEQAQTAISILDSYTEISASGNGLHIFVRAEKPTEECRRGGVEVYSKNRFIAMTGIVFDDCLYTIESRQQELKTLWKIWFPVKSTVRRIKETFTSDTEQEKLIELAKRNRKFRELWEGVGFLDHSGADLALCNYLAFITDNNPALMDALFRQSRLMRPKWDESRGSLTYGERTIRKALQR